MNDVSLYRLLARRYAPPAWALFPEVHNGTGAHFRRAADAVAMSVWPSRGLELLGFEMKCSRGDVLRELGDPEKSVAVQQYCDRWWLVLDDATHLMAGELPPTWGCLVRRGPQLRVLHEAPKLDAKPIDRKFLAALLRRTAEMSVPRAMVEDTVQERLIEATRMADARADRAEKDRASTLATIQSFEAASGVRLAHWDGGHVGKVFQAIDRPDHLEPLYQRVEAAMVEAQRTSTQLAETLAELRRVRSQLNLAALHPATAKESTG